MKNSARRSNKKPTVRAVLALIGMTWLAGASMQAAITGQWDFNNTANPLAATTGAPLEFFDGPGGDTDLGTQTGTTTALGLPDIGGQPANVMVFPKCTPLMGYYIVPGIPENGPSGKAENYTILMDILWPAASSGKWRSLIQISDVYTNPNSTDGELFVNTGNGIGISGAYSGTLLPDTWHRVAFVKEGTSLSKYIDGELVGTQTLGAAGADWNFEPHPNGLGILFGDNDDETESGVLNSLQIHDEPLSRGQIVALGGPQATGLPQVLPDVPSFVEEWIPATPFARASTDVGAVINAGSSLITNVRLNLDGTDLDNVQTTEEGELVTARATPPEPFPPMSDHVLVLTYDDDKGGAKSFTNSFRIPIFYEDFDLLELQNSADPAIGGEPNTGTNVWTQTPPDGWAIDNSQMPPQSSPPSGRPEWEGWAFADWEWVYTRVDAQERQNFTKSRGTVATADPDEWDDFGNPKLNRGYFNSFLVTTSVDLTGVAANTAFLQFDSSWRPEGFDDAGPDGIASNNQTATVVMSVDGGAPVEIMRWDSDSSGDFYHPDNVNETVIIPLNNPAGSSSVVLTFGLTNAANDWWWAIDNIVVDAGAVPPEVTGHPTSATRLAGGWVSFSVTASGPNLSYQWQKDEQDIDGATSDTYTIDPVSATDGASYRCVVSNPDGSDTSDAASLTVLAQYPDPASLQSGLSAYLPFENDYNDASENNLNGTPVGSPTFAAGQVGSAVQITNQGETRNFVSLGETASMSFGQTSDFTVAFWMKTDRVSGDPVVVGNKDWDSGGNTGWLVGTQNDGRIEWSYKRSTETRKDYDSTIGNVLNNGRWAHVAVVWNINGEALTYYDGFLVNQQPISPGNGDVYAAGSSLNLGQDGFGDYGSEWDGLLDEVALWNRALTADEVLALYGTGLQGSSFLDPAPPAPTLDFSLGDGQLTLTWQGEGFALEENGDLGNPAGWSIVPGAGANSATVPTAAGTKFYRLKR
jgi:hypothetical protein